jgi:hypothetical protein
VKSIHELAVGGVYIGFVQLRARGIANADINVSDLSWSLGQNDDRGHGNQRDENHSDCKGLFHKHPTWETE